MSEHPSHEPAGAARTGMVHGYVVIGLILVTTFVWILVGMSGFASL